MPLPDWMIREAVKITPFEEEAERPGVISYGLTSYGYDARVGWVFKVFNNVFCGVVDPKRFDPRAFTVIDQSPRLCDFTKKAKSMRHPFEWVCEDCKEAVPFQGERDAPPRVCPAKEQPDPFILIPPNSFALAETVEHFEIPRSVLAVCLGKSTYARCGIIVNVTPLEPEWRGKVTVEISNTTPLPAAIHCGEGIMQVLFLQSAGVTEAVREAVRRMCSQNAREFIHGEGCDDKADMDPHAEYMKHIEDKFNGELGQSTCQRSYADKRAGKGGKYQSQAGLTDPKVDGIDGA